MRSIIVASLLAISGAAAAADAPTPAPAEPPRPFSLTEAQAQDYANRLQTEMRQAQAVLQADQQVLSELARQVKPADPVPAPHQEKKK